jgi:hypothetical protein
VDCAVIRYTTGKARSLPREADQHELIRFDDLHIDDPAIDFAYETIRSMSLVL